MLLSYKQPLNCLKKYFQAFACLDSFEVVALTRDYFYLTDELGIVVSAFMLKPEINWRQEDLSAGDSSQGETI